jgi:hypothetical protein
MNTKLTSSDFGRKIIEIHNDWCVANNLPQAMLDADHLTSVDEPELVSGDHYFPHKETQHATTK